MMRLSGRVVFLPPSERGFRRLKGALGRNFTKCARQHAGGKARRAKYLLREFTALRCRVINRSGTVVITASVDRRVNGGFFISPAYNDCCLSKRWKALRQATFGVALAKLNSTI